jgi:glucokinase
MTEIALGIDLGGTNLRAAAIDRSGAVLFQSQQKTLADEGPDAVIQRIALAIAEAAERARAPAEIAVGVAAPGPLDPRAGIVYTTPNLPGWRNVPLAARLQQMTGRVIYLGNDANAAALGELYFGCGRGRRNLVYVGLGTGVGGGVISEGRLIDGWRGMGGELGHTSVDFNGPRCTCGSVGCIEAFCSAWALRRDAAMIVASGRGDAIVAAAAGHEPGPRALGMAAEAGDREARVVLERAGSALGVGLANFVNIFNPEVLVVGGGVAEIGAPLLEPARRMLDACALPPIRAGVELVPSSLGLDTGIYGAAALVFHAGHP